MVLLAGGSGAALWAHLPVMSVSGKYLNFAAAPGGSNPAAQTVTLGTNEHPYQWTAAVATASGGGWLAVSPASGSLNGNFASVPLRISVTSASLAAGTYYGRITLTAPFTDNSPTVIEVALAINPSSQPAPGFALTPSSVSLETVRGGPTAAQSIQVANAGGGALAWTGTPSTDGGGNWLSLTPGSGVNGGILTIAANPGQLSPGDYTGRVMFAAPGAANSPQSVAVSFRVRDPRPASLLVNVTAMTFSSPARAPNPPSQTMVISNPGEGTLSWRVQVVTFSGGLWLTATPGTGSGFGVVAVTAETGELEAGTYVGRIEVTASGALNSPAQIPVMFTIGRQRPQFTSNGVVSAATFQPTPVAPGGILSIFGSALGPAAGVSYTLDPATGKLPVSLAGTRITFDGVAAPLFFVSNGQVNLQAPFEVAGRGSTRMAVNVEGLDPAEMTLPVTEAAPGLFTLDGTRAAALNQDSTLNGPDNPAAVGSVVQLFLTGQGLLDSNVETGALAPASPPFPAPRLPVVVNIDALSAKVMFAGLAPGFAGLLQINAEVPRGVAPSGQARVVVAVGLAQAVKVATIAVQ